MNSLYFRNLADRAANFFTVFSTSSDFLDLIEVSDNHDYDFVNMVEDEDECDCRDQGPSG